MPKVTIDGRTIEVAPGTNLIEAAKQLGIDIPFYCYHPQLPVVASCRMCLVEVEKAPKPLPACATIATDGLVVRTDSPGIKEERERVLEFLLLNHPLDCPICDRAGECLLQDYSFAHGTVESRFREEKRVPPKKDLGGDIILYTTRCILCTRCTRFMSDIAGTGELGVMNRGARAEIDVYPGIELGDGMTGNIVDICPVGALKSKDFLFQARVWNLDMTDSVCGGCATGCSIRVDSLRGAVKRVKPRENPEVNGPWICDEGRFLWHQYYRTRERLMEPLLRRDGALAEVSWSEALDAAARGLAPYMGAGGGAAGGAASGANTIALVGSAFDTNEENFYLRELGEAFFPRHVTAVYPDRGNFPEQVFKSGFRIDSDRTPNRRGALTVLGRKDEGLRDLWTAIEGGTVTAAIWLGESYRDELTEREKGLLGTLRFLLVIDGTRSALSDAATVMLPGVPYTEKSGTYVSAGGQLQKLNQAVPPPGRAREDATVLRHLARALGRDLGSASPEAIFTELAGAVPAFAGLAWSGVPPTGLALNGTLAGSGR